MTALGPYGRISPKEEALTAFGVPVGDANPFGVPESLDEFEALMGEADVGGVGSDRQIQSLLRRAGEDMALMTATRRWAFTPRREPRQMVPGDVIAMRADLVFAAVGGGAVARFEPAPEGCALAEEILSSRPYWLPAPSIAGILAAKPPVEKPRLPWPRTTVWFGEPIQVPAGLVFPRRLMAAAERLERNSVPVHKVMSQAMTAVAALVRRPDMARIRGLLILARDDGEPIDAVGWLVEVASAEDDGWPARLVLLARRSLCAWRPMVEMVDALVAWGDWTEPEPMERPDRPDRAWSRGLRYGRTKDREEGGALAGVRLVDTRRRAHREYEPSGGTHASPVTHTRVGHWRSQVVGPRDAGLREPRFIPATVVNPGGAAVRPAVYILPRPA